MRCLLSVVPAASHGLGRGLEIDSSNISGEPFFDEFQNEFAYVCHQDRYDQPLATVVVNVDYLALNRHSFVLKI